MKLRDKWGFLFCIILLCACFFLVSSCQKEHKSYKTSSVNEILDQVKGYYSELNVNMICRTEAKHVLVTPAEFSRLEKILAEHLNNEWEFLNVHYTDPPFSAFILFKRVQCKTIDKVENLMNIE